MLLLLHLISKTMYSNQAQLYQSIQKHLVIFEKLINTFLMFSLLIEKVQRYYLFNENITGLQKLFAKKYHNTNLLLQ